MPNVPLPQPTPQVAEVQAAEQQLDRDNVQQIVKEIILRLVVKKEIRENEQQQILTSVTITDLASQRTLVGHNQDTEHFAASVNKVPVALLLLEDLRAGTVSLDQIVRWAESDRRGGSGVFDRPGAPLQAPVRDVLFDLFNRSGNTAVRVVVNNLLEGAPAVNSRFAAKPQLAHTYLQPLDGPGGRFYLGNSTSRDSLWALSELLKTKDQYSDFMKNALSTNIFTDFGVRSQLAGNNYIVLANKIGALNDVEGNNRHDVGIVYNTETGKSYGYSFFSTAPFNETDPSATLRAEQALKNMGRYTLRFSGDRRVHNIPQTAPQTNSIESVESRVLY